MHLWGEFQSLIQLSIGLNGAFALLSTYLSNIIQRQIELTEIHFHHAVDLEKSVNLATTVNKQPTSLSTRFSDLIDEFKQVGEIYDNNLIAILRIICTYLAIFSIFISIYAAYKYVTPINSVVRWYATIQLGPFLIGIIYAAFLSSFSLWPKYAKRQKLLNELRELSRQQSAFVRCVESAKEPASQTHVNPPDGVP